jgi:hypothetical protein
LVNTFILELTLVKKIFLIHGRDFKPDKEDLQKLWVESIASGIERDYGLDMLSKFETLIQNDLEFIYYGDISNRFLSSENKEYSKEKDLKDRKKTLKHLKAYSKDAFKEETYSNLPDAKPWKEALADTFSGAFNILGLAKTAVSFVAPDMPHYWDENYEFGTEVRMRLNKPLSNALKADEDILIISHSLGTMIAYDVLWKFSHKGEYKEIKDKKVTKLITLGSPLGDEVIKDNLKGGNLKGIRKYPTNIKTWINIAAEDDFISHDSDIKNDFKEMQMWGLVDSIEDKLIYNLAVRNGSSNPHHGAGYLIDPIVIEEIVRWL